MEAKDAVRIAKSYVADMYSEENITQIGLEELEYDEHAKAWLVTVGFRRPWPRAHEQTSPHLAVMFPRDYPNRWYKQVEVDDDRGAPVSIRDRDLIRAA